MNLKTFYVHIYFIFLEAQKMNIKHCSYVFYRSTSNVFLSLVSKGRIYRPATFNSTRSRFSFTFLTTCIFDLCVIIFPELYMRYVSISSFSCFGCCQQLARAGFIGLQRLKPPSPHTRWDFHVLQMEICKEKDEICLWSDIYLHPFLNSQYFEGMAFIMGNCDFQTIWKGLKKYK